jgi:hypothetical protein
MYNVAKNKYRKKELIKEYGAIIPWIFLYRSRLSHSCMIWLLAPLPPVSKARLWQDVVSLKKCVPG